MLELHLHKTLLATTGSLSLKIQTQIPTGQITALFGASGTGKTSILRMIAGLLKPENGQIVVNEQTWYSSKQKVWLKPQQRNIGYVFQDYALFPHMTVRQNLEFALNTKARKQHRATIEELIALVELQQLQYRKPPTLSGGQKQRVALARALVTQPDLLLLDEPLSALDQVMRQKLQDYLLQLHQKFRPTILLVSHEISEIFKVSHQVIVLEHGRIVKQGAPLQVFSPQQISGKFQLAGKVLQIDKEDVLYVVVVLAGSQVLKVAANASDISNLSIGDQVLVASKTFSPLIRKI